MQIDLTQIAVAIIALLGAIVTKFLIPLLQSKLSVENGKISENQAAILKMAIQTAVRAAEQIYNSNEGEKKKSYVLAILQSQGFTVNTSAVDAAVEAEVLNLHRMLE